MTFPHLGGFESTQIFGSGQDVLGTIQHIERWQSDLALLLDAGIVQLRYSVPWHRIEGRCGEFDWSWLDGPMRFMERAGLQPIADPLHHTSFPGWLTNGFLNPSFPELYCRFVQQVAERYPFIRRYTVFNEPLPTTLFCSYTGMWYPHLASHRDFAHMALAVARAITSTCRMLRRIDPTIELVHVESCEHHQGHTQQATDWVGFANERRFLMTDLTLGRVDSSHPLFRYLTRHGVTPEEIDRVKDEPGAIDVLGLDYYIHSEMDWIEGEKSLRPVAEAPRGFCSVAGDYTTRYRLPVMLSETNIRGTVEERLHWLRFMESECSRLAAQTDFRGFCWYPTIDTTDWANACTRLTGEIDPQGIWLLDPVNRNRVASELSDCYSALACGEMTWEQIPPYPLSPDVERSLRGYVPLGF